LSYYNNQNAVSIIERNGAEACAIFTIKIEEYARGEGFSLIVLSSSKSIFKRYGTLAHGLIRDSW